MAGCGGGGGDDLVTRGEVRNCLAQQGLTLKAPSGATAGYAPLASASPEFAAYFADGRYVNVVVARSEVRARREVADIKSALQTFGVTDAKNRVILSRNAAAIFDKAPQPAQRDVVAGCLR